MAKKVFISYKHEPKEWVKKRLVSCLEAGGAGVIIDYQHFQASPLLARWINTRIRLICRFWSFRLII